MPDIVAIYGSPRRKGNTATLTDRAVAGAQSAGAQVRKFVLRDYKISPCLEIYGCKKDGHCVIKDDFHLIRDAVLSARGLILSSPIFFYALSAHTKALFDRCQSLWVKKYWIDKVPFGQGEIKRHGLFISAGATSGKKLFDGSLLSVKYFMDVFDMDLWASLLVRGVDFQGDIDKRPEELAKAEELGKALAAACEDLPG